MVNINRRNLLKSLCAGACGSLVHRSIFPDGGLMAYAMPPGVMGALGSNPIMLVINFAGGADQISMSTLYTSWFMQNNPTLAYTPETSIPLNSEQGLHPSLTCLKQLWDEKTFSIVNMVGMGENGVATYTRAHDLDTDAKLSGYTSGSTAYGGWAPRLTAQMSSSLGGISMADEALVIQGDINPPRAIGNLNTFGENGFLWGDNDDWFRYTRDSILINSDGPASNKHKFVRDSMLNVQAASQTLAKYADMQLPVQFPQTGIGNNLADVAKIINANVGAQFFFIQQGGYDTHSGARAAVTNLLNQLNPALQAFVDCAKAQGWWQRVLCITMSEFSRTVENENAGNDHGFSGSMWVFGGGLNGGRIIAPPPTAADLGGGSYVRNYHVDYRAVFKEAINAMGYNADLVFPHPIANSVYTPTGIFT
jgi:uncharacterized protein (DUF1501 family)